MTTARERHRKDLLDDLQLVPTGLTVDQLMGANGWNHQTTNTAIHDLRLWLGEHEDMALVCEPQGHGRRWLYRLVANLDGMREWGSYRMKDVHSRLRVLDASMSSIVRATNGRTKEGRKARVTEKALRRLVEDLEDIDLDGSVTP